MLAARRQVEQIAPDVADERDEPSVAQAGAGVGAPRCHVEEILHVPAAPLGLQALCGSCKTDVQHQELGPHRAAVQSALEEGGQIPPRQALVRWERLVRRLGLLCKPVLVPGCRPTVRRLLGADAQLHATSTVARVALIDGRKQAPTTRRTLG